MFNFSITSNNILQMPEIDHPFHLNVHEVEFYLNCIVKIAYTKTLVEIAQNEKPSFLSK